MCHPEHPVLNSHDEYELFKLRHLAPKLSLFLWEGAVERPV